MLEWGVLSRFLVLDRERRLEFGDAFRIIDEVAILNLLSLFESHVLRVVLDLP